MNGCSALTSAPPPDTLPPSAPANLTVTPASSTQLNLSWPASTDNVGVTGYMVERCPGAGCSNFTQIATPTITTFNDTGLNASTSYSYRVRATDAANNPSPYSPTATASTMAGPDTIPPSAPLSPSPTRFAEGGAGIDGARRAKQPGSYGGFGHTNQSRVDRLDRQRRSHRL